MALNWPNQQRIKVEKDLGSHLLQTPISFRKCSGNSIKVQVINSVFQGSSSEYTTCNELLSRAFGFNKDNYGNCFMWLEQGIHEIIHVKHFTQY
jgi:hypothetical protein